MFKVLFCEEKFKIFQIEEISFFSYLPMYRTGPNYPKNIVFQSYIMRLRSLNMRTRFLQYVRSTPYIDRAFLRTYRSIVFFIQTYLLKVHQNFMFIDTNTNESGHGKNLRNQNLLKFKRRFALNPLMSKFFPENNFCFTPYIFF